MTAVRQFSLSEIDALSRKAARGAGYSWGMAEEAGRSVRWLAAYDLQGPEALAAWLGFRSADSVQHLPGLREGRWQAANGICPITAGTIVNDREGQLLDGSRFEFTNVQQPVLMLSMVARIVENSDRIAIFQQGDFSFACASQGIVCPVGVEWQMPEADVSCFLAEPGLTLADNIIKPSAQSRNLSERASELLHELAHQTYVPATEASRLSGAGSGLNDND